MPGVMILIRRSSCIVSYMYYHADTAKFSPYECVTLCNSIKYTNFVSKLTHYLRNIHLLLFHWLTSSAPHLSDPDELSSLSCTPYRVVSSGAR